MGHDIHEDKTFQRRYRRGQRTAWLVMLVVLALAAAGLFGGGPLGEQTFRTVVPLPATLSLPRFALYFEYASMTVTARPPAGSRVLEVAVSRELAGLLNPFEFQPAPTSTALTPEAVVYRFALAGEGEVQVTFSLLPRVAGVANGQVRVAAGGREAVFGPFWVLVYP